VQPNLLLIEKALQGHLVVPDFPLRVKDLTDLYAVAPREPHRQGG
jgi:hypothetical protein